MIYDGFLPDMCLLGYAVYSEQSGCIRISAIVCSHKIVFKKMLMDFVNSEHHERHVTGYNFNVWMNVIFLMRFKLKNVIIDDVLR